jgi:tetratricopeptide (TPR) repeat protein
MSDHGPEWLADDPAQRPTLRPWTLRDATQSLTDLAGGAVEATRRELVLIAGGTLTSALLSWLTADPVAADQITTGQHIGEAAVVKVEERARMLRHMDDEDGGGSLLAETSSALALVKGMILHRSSSSAHRTRLYAAASDLARQRAAALFDVNGQCADTAFETALRLARVAGDDALGANALAFWSVSAYNTGRLRDAVAMADTGLAAVRGHTTPRVEAMLTSRRGRARAHLGDERCWSDFDRAEGLLAQAPGKEDPDWAYWFDSAELLGARASSHRDRNQPGPAADAFAQAHALYATSHPCVRTHALYLSRQADAQLAQQQVEQACATAHNALDLTETISSQRTTGPLLDLAERLAAYTVPAAQEYRDRARTVLAS